MWVIGASPARGAASDADEPRDALDALGEIVEFAAEPPPADARTAPREVAYAVDRRDPTSLAPLWGAFVHDR